MAIGQAELNRQLAGTRVPFVANQGQTEDQVAFYAPTFAGTVYVTKRGELVYALSRRAGAAPGARQDGLPPPGRNDTDPATGDAGTAIGDIGTKPGAAADGIVLVEELVGIRTAAIEGRGREAAAVNIFRGNDPEKWQRGISTYRSVSLGEVYEGIEVELEAYGGTVEKIFRVDPGASPERIRLRVGGGKGLVITGEGELAVATDMGAVTFSRPIAYQEIEGRRQRVDVEYSVEGEQYGFQVGEYDAGHELVIDPVLAASFLGGSSGETAHALAIDGDGNVYVAGTTSSADFPGLTVDSADNTFAGGREAFVVLLDANLTTIVAATFLGGFPAGPVAKTDSIRAMALSGTGDVYVTGATTAADFPGISPALSFDSTFAGKEEGFVARLSADLSQLVNATFLGGSNDEWVNAIALTPGGALILAGHTSSPDFPCLGASPAACFAGVSPADGVYEGQREAFVVRMGSGLGGVNAATFLGGPDLEGAAAVAVDGSGHVFVAGNAGIAGFPCLSATPANCAVGASADGTAVGSEAFVVRLNLGLSVIDGATYLGGSYFDRAEALALDGVGGVYVGGHTGSSDFPCVGDFSLFTCIGVQPADSDFTGNEGFVVRLNADGPFPLGTIFGGTFLGGKGQENRVFALAVSGDGEVLAAGSTRSLEFPGIDAGSADQAVGGGLEGWVAKLKGDLSAPILAATYVGGSQWDSVRALALNSAGQVYVAGETSSVDLPGIDSDSADKNLVFLGPAQGSIGDEAFVMVISSSLKSQLLTNFELLKNIVGQCFGCSEQATEFLLGRVELAIQHFLRGNNRAAAGAMEQFVDAVERYVGRQDVPRDEGNRFLVLAQAILVELQGSGARR
jgi:hypothetical protein